MRNSRPLRLSTTCAIRSGIARARQKVRRRLVACPVLHGHSHVSETDLHTAAKRNRPERRRFMSRTFYLGCAAVLFGLAGCSSDSQDENVGSDFRSVSGQSLLANPGFENGTAAPWQPWGTFSVVSGNAHTGVYAADVGTANGGGQRVPVTAGKSYTYSAFGKAGGGGGNALLTLKYYGASGNQVGGELTSSPFSGSYAERSIVSTVPSGATAAQLGFWNSSNGSLVLDDFSFSDDAGGGSGGSGGGPSGTNLLTNGDFENGVGSWQAWGSFSVSGAQDARSGARAAMVPPNNGGGQIVEVTPGTQYTLTAWGKASGSGWNGVNFKFFDS